MLAFSPLMYVFVLGKGETQKKIDDFLKKHITGALGEGGKILIKVLVILFLLVVVFPVIFYIALNGVAYYSITWTVQTAAEFIGGDETKQMAVGGVIAVIGLIVIVQGTDDTSEDDKDDGGDYEDNGEPKEKT